jgi:hypothetical protein
MADHYRQFSIAVRIHGQLAAAWITETLRSRRRQRHVIGVDFDWALKEGYLHLTDHDERGNVEHVALFLRELVALGYVHEPVPIYWADTCSRHWPNAFMGGAAIVTRRRTYWFVLPELVERKLRAIEQRRRTRT